MRVIRCKQSLTVTLSGGRIIQTNECTDELFEKIKVLQEQDDEFELINLLIPEKENEDGVTKARLIQFWKNTQKSSALTKEKDSVYWKEVSPLSMPLSFAEKVMKAEKEGNETELEAYKNFWTLLSLNSDKVVRENLFKFLEKWGMVITKSGLFVGYRNVATKSGETDVFTDQHSHTFTITIGKMVTMPREQCDSNSGNECSRGLHLGGTSWLQKNYYGTVGLVCLCNPVDVVAVPWANASYGKLRTCAYMPIARAEYDSTGHIIPFSTESGMEEPFVPSILYDGVMATEEEALYKIPIPRTGEDKALYSAESVSEKVLNIARQYMKKDE